MSLKNVFNRIKREIGIKHCIIIEGNVGDIYLDEKGQILDLKEYLKNMTVGNHVLEAKFAAKTIPITVNVTA